MRKELLKGAVTVAHPPLSKFQKEKRIALFYEGDAGGPVITFMNIRMLLRCDNC